MESERDKFKADLTPGALEEWMLHFKDDDEVKRLATNIVNLHEAVFVTGKIDHIAFELPDKLDKNKYI